MRSSSVRQVKIRLALVVLGAVGAVVCYAVAAVAIYQSDWAKAAAFMLLARFCLTEGGEA